MQMTWFSGDSEEDPMVMVGRFVDVCRMRGLKSMQVMNGEEGLE